MARNDKLGPAGEALHCADALRAITDCTSARTPAHVRSGRRLLSLFLTFCVCVGGHKRPLNSQTLIENFTVSSPLLVTSLSCQCLQSYQILHHSAFF
jgi:hypothetical protein